MRFGVRCSSSYYLDYSYFSKGCQKYIPFEHSCEFPSIQPVPKFATAEYEQRPDYSSFKKQRNQGSQTRVKFIKSQGTRSKKQKNEKYEYPPEYVEIGDVKKKSVSSLCQGVKPDLLQLNEDHKGLIKSYRVTSDQTNKFKTVRNVQSDPQMKDKCLTSKHVDPKRRRVLRCIRTRRYRNEKKKQGTDKVTSKYDDMCNKIIKKEEANIEVLRKKIQYREIPSLYSAYSSMLNSLKNFKPKKNSQKVETDLYRKTRRKQPRCYCSKEFLCECDKKSKSVCTCQRVADTGSQTRKNDPRCFCLKDFSCSCHLKSKSVCTCQKVTDTGSQTQKKQLRCFCTRGLVCDKKLKTVCTCQRFRKTRCLCKLKKRSKSYDHIISSKHKRQPERRKQVKDAKICPTSFSVPSQLNETVHIKNPNRKKHKEKSTDSNSQATKKQESSFYLKQLFCIKTNKRSVNEIEFKKIAQKTAEHLRKKLLLIKNRVKETKKRILAKDTYMQPKSWSSQSHVHMSESVPITKSSRKKPKHKFTDESSQTRREQPDCPCLRDFVCVCDKELRRVCTYDKLAKTRHVSRLKKTSDSSIIMSKSKTPLKKRLQTGNTRIRSKSLDAQQHANLLQVSEPLSIKKSRKKKHKPKPTDSSSQTWQKQPSCLCSNDLICVCGKKLKSVCKCNKFGKTGLVPMVKTTSDSLLVTSKSKSQLKPYMQVQPQLSQSRSTKKTSHGKRRHSRSQSHKQTPSCLCFKDLFCVCDKKLKSVCTCQKIRNSEYVSKLRNSSYSSNHIIASQPKHEISHYQEFKTKSIKPEMINKNIPSESNRSIMSDPIKHDVIQDISHMKTVRKQEKISQQKPRRYTSPTLSNHTVDQKPSTIMTPSKRKIETRQAKKEYTVANNGVAAKMKKQYKDIHHFIKQMIIGSKNKYKSVFERQAYKNRRKDIIFSCPYPKKDRRCVGQPSSPKVMKRLSKTPRNVYQLATTESFSSEKTVLNRNRNGKIKNKNDLQHEGEMNVEKEAVQDPKMKPTLKSVVDHNYSLAATLCKCLTKARHTKKSEENYLKQDKNAIKETKRNAGQIYVPKKLNHKAIKHPFIKPQALYCENSNKSSQKLVAKHKDDNKKIPTNLNRPEVFDKYNMPETKMGTFYNPISAAISRCVVRYGKYRDKANKNIRTNHGMKNKTDYIKNSEAHVITDNNIDAMKNNRDPNVFNITAVDRPLKRYIKNKGRKKNNLNSNNSQELTPKCSRDINKYSKRKTRKHDQYALDKYALAKPGIDLISMNSHSQCRDVDSQFKSRIKYDEEKKNLDVEDLKLIDSIEIKQNQQQSLQNIRYNIIKVSNPTAGYRSSASVRYCECTNTESGNPPLKNRLKKKKRNDKRKTLFNEIVTGLPKPEINVNGFEEQLPITYDKKRRTVKQGQQKSLQNNVNVFPSKSTTNVQCTVVKRHRDYNRLSKKMEKLLDKRNKGKTNFLFKQDDYIDSLKIPTNQMQKQREDISGNENTYFSKSIMNSVKASSNKVKKREPLNSKIGSNVIVSEDTFNPTPSNIISVCKCTTKVKDNFSNEGNFKKPRRDLKDRADHVKTHSNSFGKLSRAFISAMPTQEIIDCKITKDSNKGFKTSRLAKKQEPIGTKINTSAITSKYAVNHRPSHIASIRKSTNKNMNQFIMNDNYKKRRCNVKNNVGCVKTNSNSNEFTKSSKPVINPLPARPITDCLCTKVSKKLFKSSSNKVKNLGSPNVGDECKNKIREQIIGKEDFRTQKSNLEDYVHRVKTYTSPIGVAKTFISSMPTGADCVCRSQVNQYIPFKGTNKHYENNEQRSDIVDANMKTKRQQKNIYSLPTKISGKCDAKVSDVVEVPKRRNEYELKQLSACCIKSGPEYTSDENKSEFFRPLEKCYLRKYNNTEGKLWKLKKNLITLQNYRATVIPRPIIVSKPTYKQCECRHLPFKNKRLQKKQIRDSQGFVNRNHCPGNTIVGSDQTNKLENTCINSRSLRNSELKIKPKLTSVEQQCKSRKKIVPYSTIENGCTASRSHILSCKPIFKFRTLKEIKDCGNTSKINKHISNDTQTVCSRPLLTECLSKRDVTPIIKECMQNSLQTKFKCASKNRHTDAETSSCCKNKLNSIFSKNKYKCVDDANIETKKYSNFFVNNVLQTSDIPNVGSVMLFCKCGNTTIPSKKHKFGERKGHSQMCTKVYNCGNDAKMNKCDTKRLEKTSCKKAVTVVSAPTFSCGCARKTGPYLVIDNCSRNLKCNETRLNPKLDYYIDNANVKLYNSKSQINIAIKPAFSLDSPKRKSTKKRKTLSYCRCKELSKTSKKKSVDANTPTVANTQSICNSLCKKLKSVVRQRIPLLNFGQKQVDKMGRKSVASCWCKKEMLSRSQIKRKRRAKLLAKKAIESDRLEKMQIKEMEKKIQDEQKKLKAEEKDVAKIDESYGTHCLSGFFFGIVAIGARTAHYLIKNILKIIIQPKRSYKYTRHMLKYPTKTIKYIREWCSIIWQRQFLRMAGTIKGSRTMTIIADEIQELPLYQAIECRNKTPKEIKAMKIQSRIRRRRREFRDRLAMQGCNNNLFILTLRRMPCFWLYHVCPHFYPQCLTILKIWRDYTNLVLFCLAIFVWSPCILAFELCRTLMCCLLCAR